MNAIVKFEFNKVTFGEPGNEMLDLTAMWRACGSVHSKRPDQWIRKEGRPFIEFLDENLKATQGSFELIQTVRGGKNPCTKAHWQVGMAYAKYLNHALHAYCNQVVRDHIE